MNKKVSLKVLGSNQTEVVLNDEYVLFFSYDTLVGVSCDGKLYITRTKYSKTTLKHISSWVGCANFTLVNQDELEAMVK